MRHLTCTRPEHPPREQGAEDGVADARPRCGKTVFEAELTRVADEHHRREIAGAVGERADPRPDVATAEHEPVDGGGGFTAVHTHADRDGDEHDHQQYLNFHFFPFFNRVRPLSRAGGPR